MPQIAGSRPAHSVNQRADRQSSPSGSLPNILSPAYLNPAYLNPAYLNPACTSERHERPTSEEVLECEVNLVSFSAITVHSGLRKIGVHKDRSTTPTQ